MQDIKEFEKWYKEINKPNEQIVYLKFVWELIKTPFIEYHYSIAIDKNTNDEFKIILWKEFIKQKDAENYLLKKLGNNEDEKYIGKIIFTLGKIIYRGNGKQKEKVLDYVKKLINSPNDDIRENSIIVLGWLAGFEEIELLGEKLLQDKYYKCRAWSATSFMQIWFRIKDENFVEKVLPFLYKSIKQETNLYVIACIVETVQELTKKKFGLSQKDSEPIENPEKIEIAKNKVIKYFEKKYE